jgi:hypothetical protein
MAETDVFVSYLPSEADSLAPILQGLEELGFGFDLRSVGAGEEWLASIEDALRGARAFIFLVTPRFQRSRWTQFEIGVAASRAAGSPDVRIIPILTAGASWDDVPRALRGHRGIDANHLPAREVVRQVVEAIED